MAAAETGPPCHPFGARSNPVRNNVRGSVRYRGTTLDQDDGGWVIRVSESEQVGVVERGRVVVVVETIKLYHVQTGRFSANNERGRVWALLLLLLLFVCCD